MRFFELALMAVFLVVLVLFYKTFGNKSEESRHKIFKSLLGTILVSTIALIYMGAMTVSTRSGMAFPDWPTSDGVLWPSWNYFMSQTDRFYEHVHRLLGQVVGYLAILILLCSRRYEPEDNKRLSIIIFIMICIQGCLGGITVFKNTLWLTTVLHGVFAQLCLAAMFYLTLKNCDVYKNGIPQEGFTNKVRGLAKYTFMAVIIQLFLGAIFRNKAKVFELNPQGKVVYQEIVQGNLGWLFSHMTFALPVAVLLFTLGVVLMKYKNLSSAYKFMGIAFHAMVTLQILLGIVAFFTVFHREQGKFGFAETVLTSAHVVNGAIILALTFSVLKLVNKPNGEAI